MRTSYFLIGSDECSHIAALASDEAPFWRHHQDFFAVLACWHPSPEVWTQPHMAVAAATQAVAKAPSFDAATKRWFAADSPADRLALVYGQRNDPGDRPKTGDELVEAWLLRRALVREPVEGGDARAWPVPQLTREARAAERTELQEAVALQCRAAYVPLLVAEGEDVAARDPQGATALHWTAASMVSDPGVAYSSVVWSLAEAGADLDAQDIRGRTPLDIALAKENRPVLRTLVEAGASATGEQWGTLLRMAVRLGWREVANWKNRSLAQALSGVLARPSKERMGGRLRL